MNLWHIIGGIPLEELGGWLIEVMARSTVVMGLAWLVLGQLRHRSAAVKHAVTSGSVLALAAIWVGSWILPQWKLPLLPNSDAIPMEAQVAEGSEVNVTVMESGVEFSADNSPAISAEVPTDAQAEPSFPGSLATWISTIWLTGFLSVCSVFGVHLFLLRRIRKNAELLSPDDSLCREIVEVGKLIGFDRPVQVYRAPGEIIPMTTGIQNPLLILPKSMWKWKASRRQMVMAHELAHIQRRDCLTQWIGIITAMVYWFHPGVWWLLRKMHSFQEQSCDDRVLNLGHPPAAYSRCLLELAARLNTQRLFLQPSAAMANRSRLEHRLVYILNPSISRSGVSRRFRSQLGIGVVLMAFTCSVIGLTPRQIDTPPLIEKDLAILKTSAPGELSESAENASPLPFNYAVKEDWSREGLPLILIYSKPNPSSPQIQGKVTLTGTPPPEKDMSEAIKNGDPECASCAVFSEDGTLMTQFYKVGLNQGLADVMVYISAGVEGDYPPPSSEVILQQKNCQYTPYVMAVQAGQPIRPVNLDQTMHGLHSFPKVEGNRGFMFVQIPQKTSDTFSFEKHEMFVRLKCDVHPWEFVYINIFEHPFFDITDENGVFNLPENLPPGDYTITAHHRRTGSISRNITVREGRNFWIDFRMKVPE